MKKARGQFPYKVLPVFLWVLSAGFISPACAQLSKEETFKILDKALGPLTSAKSTAIYFEGLAFGVKEPTSIFTLPAYQVFKGGFLFSEGHKFEMQLGKMKGLSDGKLLVVIDETTKKMFVDSVRSKGLIKPDKALDIGVLFREQIGDCHLEYLGRQTLQNKVCHKIKSVCRRNDKEVSAQYWIEINTNQLLLMSELQNKLYNVYWIKKTGLAPVGHDYTVRLPKKEMESFHGYEVFDHRNTSEKLKARK